MRVDDGSREMSEEEFTLIYRAFWKKLYCIGYGYVQEKYAAQELVKDVFVKLWMKRSEIEKVENIERYLLQCLQDDVYEYLAKSKCSGSTDRDKTAAVDDEKSFHPVKFDNSFSGMEPNMDTAKAIQQHLGLAKS